MEVRPATKTKPAPRQVCDVSASLWAGRVRADHDIAGMRSVAVTCQLPSYGVRRISVYGPYIAVVWSTVRGSSWPRSRSAWTGGLTRSCSSTPSTRATPPHTPRADRPHTPIPRPRSLPHVPVTPPGRWPGRRRAPGTVSASSPVVAAWRPAAQVASRTQPGELTQATANGAQLVTHKCGVGPRRA